jgi:hypothetical protein
MHLLALLMTGHSISNEWTNSNVEIVKVSMGLGIFTQTLAKCFLIPFNGETFKKMQEDVEKMYKLMERVDLKRKNVLAESVRICNLITKTLFFVDSSAVLIFLVYPPVALIFMAPETRFLMFPFYFPYVNHQTTGGFIVNSILHGILIVYTLLFHTPYDSIFALMVMQVIVKVEFIKLDLDDFEVFLVHSDTKQLKVQKQIKQNIRKIINSHLDLDSYIETLGKYYILPCFAAISTSIFSICIAMILIMIVKWPLAYGLTWALSGQLFVYFLYGSIIHSQMNQLEHHFRNFPLTLLSISDQKTFLLMILKAQRPPGLTMLFIGQLEMETFTTVRLKFLEIHEKLKIILLIRFVTRFIRSTRSVKTLSELRNDEIVGVADMHVHSLNSQKSINVHE